MASGKSASLDRSGGVADINALRDQFALFDRDGDGLITARELGVTSRALGLGLSPSDLQDLVNEVCEDGGGQLTFEDFLLLMRGALGPQDVDEELSATYDALLTACGRDLDDSLVRRDLAQLTTGDGLVLSTADVEETFTAAGVTEPNGRLTREAFCALLRRDCALSPAAAALVHSAAVRGREGHDGGDGDGGDGGGGHEAGDGDVEEMLRDALGDDDGEDDSGSADDGEDGESEGGGTGEGGAAAAGGVEDSARERRLSEQQDDEGEGEGGGGGGSDEEVREGA